MTIVIAVRVCYVYEDGAKGLRLNVYTLYLDLQYIQVLYHGDSTDPYNHSIENVNMSGINWTCLCSCSKLAAAEEGDVRYS